MAATAPDVTIIVIVYNDADRLPRAVESVRRQTHGNIEIIISDDHSTDHTPSVAQALAKVDKRIVHHRLPANSGGCGAPRNAAIEIARAPYLMFLDSDDELPERACETLLKVLREDDALDFAMGAVQRVRTDTGGTSVWQRHLVSRSRTVRGLQAEPGLLFNPLSTDKMYRKAFIDRHQLRFPVDIHYEDQIFSTQAYVLARAFAITSEPVYRWYIAPHEAAETATISNRRHLMANVSDRIAVHRLIDDFLRENDHADVQAAKDHKFLAHDLRLYLGDLPYRAEEWIKQFAEETEPYLAGLAPEAFDRLPRDQRAIIALLRCGRYEEARQAARGLGSQVAPREVVRGADGRTYWGTTAPADPVAARELDVTDLELSALPFRAALLRHEITEITPTTGSRITLRIRTYDPGAQLPMGPVTATVHLAPTEKRYKTSFRLDPVSPGLFEGTVTLDLSAVPLPPHGFAGTRHPVLAITEHCQHNTGPLLAPLDFPALTKKIAYHQGFAPHMVTVIPEGHDAGRLQVTWKPVGFLDVARRRLPASLRSDKMSRAVRLMRSVGR